MRAVAEYRAKKEAIEFQKQEELRKQFPHLFSQDKVQKYQTSRLNRVPTSIRSGYQQILEEEKIKNTLTPRKPQQKRGVGTGMKNGTKESPNKGKAKRTSNKPLKSSIQTDRGERLPYLRLTSPLYGTTVEDTSPSASQATTSRVDSPDSPVMTYKPFSFLTEVEGTTLWPSAEVPVPTEEVQRSRDEDLDDIFNLDLGLYSQEIQEPIPRGLYQTTSHPHFEQSAGGHQHVPAVEYRWKLAEAQVHETV